MSAKESKERAEQVQRVINCWIEDALEAPGEVVMREGAFIIDTEVQTGPMQEAG